MGTFSKSSENEKDKATENLIKLPQGGEFIEILEENQQRALQKSSLEAKDDPNYNFLPASPIKSKYMDTIKSVESAQLSPEKTLISKITAQSSNQDRLKT